MTNRMQYLGSHEGLSQNSVLSIVQDHKGFMWFGTEDGGLNRFDGYEFEVYENDFNNPDSLSSNMVKALTVDRNGKLWIGTSSGGLDLYDPATKSFSHYRFPLRGDNNAASRRINAVLQGHNDILWIGTRKAGLIRFDEKNNIYHYYSHNEDEQSSISHNYIRCIYEDSKQRLWIGTVGGGLNLFDRDKNVFEQYRFQHDNPLSLSDDYVQAISEDDMGNIWIGTMNGLNRLDPETKIVTRYYHTQEDDDSLSDNLIFHINRDSKQQLWISTGRGLNIYDDAADNFIRFQHEHRQSNESNAKTVYCSYEDANGNIWIGTHTEGVYIYSPRKNHFKHIHNKSGNKNSLLGNSVYTLIQDENNKVWIGTIDGGLSRYDPQSNQFTHYMHDPNNSNSLSGYKVGTVYQDSKGIFWIGTYGKGINRFDERSGIFQHFIHDKRNENSLSDNIVIDILEDYEGILWIGTDYGGLNRFDPTTGVFKHYFNDAADDTSISSNKIWIIHQDRNRGLWFGTGTGGLNYYDREKDSFIRFIHSAENSNSISNDSVMALHENKFGQLWVGTTNGLNCFDLKTKRFTRYFKQDGLPSNSIYSIEEDTKGNLWLATTKGLSKFNPNTRKFRNYDVSDGLQGDEFIGNASITANNGELYFGGLNGITSFQPNEIQDDLQVPNVVITEFLLFNKPVTIKSGSTNSINNNHLNTDFFLKQDIGTTSELTLNYEESLFAFNFSALHYTNSTKNQYAYKLDGWDKKWIYTDYRMRRATYTNIPNGDYTFRVKASNSDGIWNERSTNVRIKILPPPWKTWWAYGLYGLAILLLTIVLFIIILEKNQVQRKQRELQREREYSRGLHQLDKLKDDFLANTSHQLCAPLNGIIDLADGLLDYEEKQLSNNAKCHLNSIMKSGRRLAHLINDILDLSKLKNKNLALQLKSIDMYTLTDVVLTIIKPLLGNKNIKLKNNIDRRISAVKADENSLQKILYNLVVNAIKFTYTGTIEIYAEKNDDKLSISVKDTGIGISKDKLTTIFQSFEQVDGNSEREYSGIGIGLAVTKQLVELHGGDVRVESQEGVGSIFTFDLPASNEEAMEINPVIVDFPVANEIISFNRPTYVSSLITTTAANDDIKKLGHGLATTNMQVSNDDTFKILIADDEEINRLIISNYLRNNQYELYEALDGEETLAALEVMHFDLILLDVMMPKISGFEVCKKIRKKYTPNEQAIIFLSAKIQHDDITEGFSIGANDYLRKPIVKKELLVRIKTHLQLVSYFRAMSEVVNR